MKHAAWILLIASGGVTAAPNDAWLEFYSGALKTDAQPAGTLEDDGNMRGFAGALPVSDNAYVRADWQQELYEFRFEAGEKPFELNRTVTALTVGLLGAGSTEYRMFGEIGAARVEWEQVGADPLFDPAGGGSQLVNTTHTATTPMLRLGFTGEDGPFSWYLTGEWLRDALQADLGEDSERWYNAWLGYQFGDHFELGVRHTRNDEFDSTGFSLRIRL